MNYIQLYIIYFIILYNKCVLNYEFQAFYYNLYFLFKTFLMIHDTI